MCAMQGNMNQQPAYGSQGNNQRYNYQPQPQQQPQSKKQQHYRFRWPVYVGIPLVILVFLWFVNGIEVAGTWEDFLDWIEIENQPRFTMLACLGLAIVAILAVARFLKKSGKGN